MSIEDAKRAFESRQSAVVELRRLADATEGRELTAYEVEQEQRLNDEITRLAQAEKDALDAIERDYGAARAGVASRHEQAKGKLDGLVEEYEQRLAGLLNGEVRSTAFTATESRQLNRVDDPDIKLRDVYGAMFEYIRELSSVMTAGATVLRTDSGERLYWPKVTGYSSATIVGEGAAIPESDPSFGPHVEINAFKYAYRVLATREILEDSIFDLGRYLVSQAGPAFADGLNRHFLVGDGVGKPKGLFTAAPVGKTLAAKTAVTADELIDIYHTLIPPYRRAATWLMHDSTAASIRKLKDNTGNYLWQESLRVGEPSTILGKPVLNDVAVPALAADAKVMSFGDLSAYYVRFAGALHVDRSEHVAFNTDQISWRFIQRADGVLMDDRAVTLVKTAA
ncbi:phage major capsid protein [Crossiella sp. CA198]|uniref:phage major capsid protein n=1 Tax=Crossiella sp. CA198 TaxID=3455607 RepID=UPI003F8D25BA